VRRNNAIVLKEGTLDLSTGKDKIEMTGDQPEMLYVAIEPVARLSAGDATPAAFIGGNTGRNNGLYAVGAAVAPNKIGLATPRPSDFDSFWSEKLVAQSKIPIHPVLTPVETDVPGVELNTFVLDALGSQAQGYVAKPAREANFPLSSFSRMPVSTPSTHTPMQPASRKAGLSSRSTHTTSSPPSLPVESRASTPSSAIPIARSPTSSTCIFATRAPSTT